MYGTPHQKRPTTTDRSSFVNRNSSTSRRGCAYCRTQIWYVNRNVRAARAFITFRAGRVHRNTDRTAGKGLAWGRATASVQGYGRTKVAPIVAVPQCAQDGGLSCRAEQRGVETSGGEWGVFFFRSQISPLRPSASGRNDIRPERIAIRQRIPAAPPVQKCRRKKEPLRVRTQRLTRKETHIAPP